MRHQHRSRSLTARITALFLVLLLVPQALPTASAQQASAPLPTSPPQPAALEQTAAEPPPLPAMHAQTPSSQQPATQDAFLVHWDALPSAPIPQQTSPTLPQQEPAQPPALPQQPVGTAAAPAEKPTGVAGSRPSGAAIAPAKQKRVRALVISFAIALAAGAAIGTVVGLSRASHSTPQ